MARTPKDPNPEFSQMPEMTIETVDYNMFYKPERASVSDGLVHYLNHYLVLFLL